MKKAFYSAIIIMLLFAFLYAYADAAFTWDYFDEVIKRDSDDWWTDAPDQIWFYARIGNTWRMYTPDGIPIGDIMWTADEFLDPLTGEEPFDWFDRNGYGAIRTTVDGVSKYGVLKNDGSLAVPCIYDNVAMCEGAFFGETDGVWRLYRIDGMQLTDIVWSNQFFLDLLSEEEKLPFNGFLNGAFGILNTRESSAWDNQYIVIDLNGEIASADWYDEFEYCGETMFFGRSNGLWHLYRFGQNEPLIDAEWTNEEFYDEVMRDGDVEFDESGLVIIPVCDSENKRYGVIDRNGEYVIEPVW